MFTVPVGEWFKGPLVVFVRDGLLSPRMLERGIFSPEGEGVLRDEHQAGRANHTRILRVVLTLELWFRIFLDAAWSKPPTYCDLDLPELSRV